MSLKKLLQLAFLCSCGDVLDQNYRITPLARGARVSIKRFKVNHLLLLEPFFGLIEYDCLSLGHLDGHRSFLVPIQVLSFALVKLLRHRSCHRILVEEEVVPVCLVVEIKFEYFLFFLLVL